MKIFQSHIFIIFCVNLFLAAFGLFWVFHCKIWTDESWYYNGALLVLKGYQPYIDFFYHRLPLHLEVYGFLFRFLGSSFLIGRIISWIIWLCLINLTAHIVFCLFKNFKFVLLSYFCFLNPTSLYGYLTNSTYSLGAFLLVVSAAALIINIKKEWRIFMFVLANFLFFDNRYLVDYQTFVLLGIIFGIGFFFRHETKVLFSLLAAVILGLLFLWPGLLNTRNLIFDTVTFNFSLTSSLSESGIWMAIGFKNKIEQFVRLRFFEFDAYYPFNVLALVAIPAIFLWFHKNKTKIFSQKELVLKYLSLIFIFNFIFYYLTVEDFPVGKLYIFPFLIILSLWLIHSLFNELIKAGSFFFAKVFLISFSFLILTQGLSSSEEFVTTSSAQADLSQLKKVLFALRQHVGDKKGFILTDTPALGTSDLVAEPRFNMEMLSFRPNLTQQEVDRYQLMNQYVIVKNVSEKKYVALIFSDDRFFGDKISGKVITPYREQIMDAVRKYYQEVEIVHSGNFRKNFHIYVIK